MGSKSKHAFIVLVLAGALGPLGCKKEASTGPQAGPPPVTVAHLQERELIDYDEYNGWLAAAETVEVRARVRGHIDKVHFRDGDLVKAGDPLFTLDERPFQADLSAVAAQLQVFEAQKVAADKDLVRLRELLQKGGASQSQVEKAEADVGSLAAQIEAARQDVERRRLDLEFATITAPIAGRIGRALLTVGNLVNAGGSDPILTTIVSIDPIYVYFDVDERSLQRYMKQGAEDPAVKKTPLRERNMQFSFGLASEEGNPHDGLLDFTENRVDQGTGTIQVRGEVPNPDGTFVAGSRARVRVPVSRPYKALLVPDTAVLTDQDRKYLLVVGPDTKVLRRDVTLGRLERDGMRVVTEGAQADDWVIVLGIQRARIHFPVTPLDADGNSVAVGSPAPKAESGTTPAQAKQD